MRISFRAYVMNSAFSYSSEEIIERWREFLKPVYTLELEQMKY